mmetsp:Transcript_68374/g.221252  ORF Transcript_68374/g.221252 Transcript_68374/m.221252 type:complete len:2394 (+) Transcript_68374:3-7184(+)
MVREGMTQQMRRAIRKKAIVGWTTFTDNAFIGNDAYITNLMMWSKVVRWQDTDVQYFEDATHTWNSNFHGAHLVVSSRSQTYLSWLRFEHGGQDEVIGAFSGRQNPCLRFETDFDSPPNRSSNSSLPPPIEGVVFFGCRSGGMVLKGAWNLTATNNIFTGTRGPAINVTVDIGGVQLDRNLALGTLRRVIGGNPAPWPYEPSAAFQLDVIPRRLAGNVAAGGDDLGFVLRPERCGATWQQLSGPATDEEANEAYGLLVGFCILRACRQPGGGPAACGDACVQVKDFRAWKNAHVGVLFVDQPASMKVFGLALSDNHIGITGTFHRQEGDMSHFFELTDSIILGKTEMSDCSLSTQGFARRGVKAGGDPVRYGSSAGSTRNIGIMVPVITNRGKTCEDGALLKDCWVPNTVEMPCALPWEQRYGTRGARNSRFLFARIKLGGYYAQCLRNGFGISFNPTSRDFNPGIYTEGVVVMDDPTLGKDAVAKILETPDANLVFLQPWAGTGVDSDCAFPVAGRYHCSGRASMWIQDDGQLTRFGHKSAILPPDAMLTIECDARFTKPEYLQLVKWQPSPTVYPRAVACGQSTPRLLNFESADSDCCGDGRRVLGALRVTRVRDRSVQLVAPEWDDIACPRGLAYGKSHFPVRVQFVHYYQSSTSTTFTSSTSSYTTSTTSSYSSTSRTTSTTTQTTKTWTTTTVTTKTTTSTTISSTTATSTSSTISRTSTTSTTSSQDTTITFTTSLTSTTSESSTTTTSKTTRTATSTTETSSTTTTSTTTSSSATSTSTSSTTRLPTEAYQLDFSESSEFPRQSRVFFFSDDYGETMNLILKIGRLRKPRIFLDRLPVGGLERQEPPLPFHPHGSYYRDTEAGTVEMILHGQNGGGMRGKGMVFVQLLEVVVMKLVLNAKPEDLQWRVILASAASSLGVAEDRIQIKAIKALPTLWEEPSRRLLEVFRSEVTLELVENAPLPSEEEFGVVRDAPGTFDITQGSEPAPPVMALYLATTAMREMAQRLEARESMRVQCIALGRINCLVPVDTGYPLLGFLLTAVPPIYTPPLNRKHCNVDENGLFYCECWKGWYGPTCDLQCNCPNFGMSHCNEGPDGDGTCVCKPGYIGRDCDQCNSGLYTPESGCNVFCSRGTNCTGHGSCQIGAQTGLPNGQCVCDKGFKYAQNFATGQLVPCAFCDDDFYPPGVCTTYCTRETRCTNKGRCNKDGACICDEKWAGWNCASCAKDFYPEGNCSLKCNVAICSPPSRCDKRGICNCEPGFFGPTCSLECPACGVKGSFGCQDGRAGSGLCDCKPGYGGALCTNNVTWTPSVWTSCFGICGEGGGVRTRTVLCQNHETGTATEPENCVGLAPPDFEPCLPPQCACTAPPNLEGSDHELTLKACPFIKSGETCELVCEGGFVAFGQFKCKGTHFVEVPACFALGAIGRGYKAVYTVMTVGDFTEWAASNLTHYIGMISEDLPKAVFGLVKEAGIAQVEPEDIMVWQFSEVTLVNGLRSGGRLLASAAPMIETVVEIPWLIKMPNSTFMHQVEELVLGMSKNPSKLLKNLENEILKRCIGFTPELTALRCPGPGRLSLLAPTITQVYLQDPIKLPPKPVGIPGVPDAIDAFGSNDTGLATGLAMVFALILLAGIGALVRCWMQKRRRSAKVAAKEDEDDSPLGAYQEVALAHNPFMLPRGDSRSQISVALKHRELDDGTSPSPPRYAEPKPLPPREDGPLAIQEQRYSTSLIQHRLDPHSVSFDLPSQDLLPAESSQARSLFELQPSTDFYSGSQFKSLQDSSLAEPSSSTLALLSLGAPLAPEEEDTQQKAKAWEEAFAVDKKEEEEGERELPDGSVFAGQFKGGQPEGWGRMDWPGGKTYMGNWFKGTPHGQGLMVSTAGFSRWIYNGEFRHGQRHGNGRCEWSDRGMWYDGDWQEGVQHGIGECGSRRGKPQFFQYVHGERKDSLSNTEVKPAPGEIIPTVVLDRRYWSQIDEKGAEAQLENGEVEIELRDWGFAVGNPRIWFSGKQGALMVTRVLENGPLQEYHLGQTNAAADPDLAIKVVPNSFIWKVEGIQDDTDAMLRLMFEEKRTKLSFVVRKPPFARCEGIKKNLHLRTPFFTEPKQLADSGWRPWLEETAQKQEQQQREREQEARMREEAERSMLRGQGGSYELALERSGSYELAMPQLPSLLFGGDSQDSLAQAWPAGGASASAGIESASMPQMNSSLAAQMSHGTLGVDYDVSEAALPSLVRLPGGVPTPEPRLVAAIRVQASSSAGSPRRSTQQHEQQQRQAQQQQQAQQPQQDKPLHPMLQRTQGAQRAGLAGGLPSGAMQGARSTSQQPPRQPGAAGGGGLANYWAQRQANGALGVQRTSSMSPTAGQGAIEGDAPTRSGQQQQPRSSSVPRQR